MCSAGSIYLILLHRFMLYPFWFPCMGVAMAGSTFKANFMPDVIKGLVEGSEQVVNFTIPSKQVIGFEPKRINIIVDDSEIVEVVGSETFHLNSSTTTNNLSFSLIGRFLGHTTVKIEAISANDNETNDKQVETADSDSILVSVIRRRRIIDNVFVISIGILTILTNLNMGCSLDFDVVKSVLKKPLGPAVGMICQFVFMPLMSFGLAHVIFTSPIMRLGLYTFGCSPGGGLSNILSYFLAGNLDLSVTMTFLSNVLAFATMPFWLLTLGQEIFHSSKLQIPYANIAISLAILAIPIFIGYLVQRYLPKVTSISRRIFGPFSAFSIVYTVILGLYVNMNMIRLFTWRVLLAGCCISLLGVSFGAFLARVLRFSMEDIIAISVETGVQNFGIAIVLLSISLPQPDADLASINALSPFLLMLVAATILILASSIRPWFRKWYKGKYRKCENGPSNAPHSNISLENDLEIMSVNS